ncbi:hypothetical protein MUP32_04030 [Candidatus Microgenomates bacterium]|nr:hypothetical protein [Candidatus Microgenomates bacterium]
MKNCLKIILILSLLLLVIASLLIAGKKILDNYQSNIPINKSKSVLVYENSGGFAGVCDYLQIMRNGQYSYEDTCRINADRYREGQLDTDEITELNRLIKEFGYFEDKWNDKMADGFGGSLKFYGSNLRNSNGNKEQIRNFANNIINKIKQAGVFTKDQTVCAGLIISIPDNWNIEKVKNPQPELSEGITYEASINKQSFKLLNTNDQTQFDINCFQITIKEKLSLEEAVETLKPTKELADFKNAKFDIFTLNQRQCARFEQWTLPAVECNPPGSKCGPAPAGIKNKEIFICPNAGDKSTGSFIYEFVKYYQGENNDDSLLNKVFSAITF